MFFLKEIDLFRWMVQKNDVVFRDRSIVRKKQTFLKSDLESIEEEKKIFGTTDLRKKFVNMKLEQHVNCSYYSISGFLELERAKRNSGRACFELFGLFLLLYKNNLKKGPGQAFSGFSC